MSEGGRIQVLLVKRGKVKRHTQVEAAQVHRDVLIPDNTGNTREEDLCSLNCVLMSSDVVFSQVVKKRPVSVERIYRELPEKREKAKTEPAKCKFRMSVRREDLGSLKVLYITSNGIYSSYRERLHNYTEYTVM